MVKGATSNGYGGNGNSSSSNDSTSKPEIGKKKKKSNNNGNDDDNTTWGRLLINNLSHLAVTVLMRVRKIRKLYSGDGCC